MFTAQPTSTKTMYGDAMSATASFCSKYYINVSTASAVLCFVMALFLSPLIA